MTKKKSISSKTQSKPNWELLVFAIPFTCFAMYMSYGFYQSYEEQKKASSTFDPVSAKILEGKVETTRISNANGSSTPIHTPQITYEYTVKDNTYQSKKFSYYGSGYSNSKDALKIVNEYPIGSTQRAYFNPNNPSEAVLNKSMPTIWWKHFWFPALFLSAGLLSLIGGMKGWLRKTK